MKELNLVTEKQGPLFGKLTRFVQRLTSKKEDKRLNFLFNEDPILLEYDWFTVLVKNYSILEKGVVLKLLIFLKYHRTFYL